MVNKDKMESEVIELLIYGVYSKLPHVQAMVLRNL